MIFAHVIAPQYSIFDNGALHAVVNLRMLVPLVVLGLAMGRRPRAQAGLAALVSIAAFFAGVVLWNRPDNPLAGFGAALAFVAAGTGLLLEGPLALPLILLSAVAVGATTGGLGRQEDAAGGVAGWFTLGIGIGAGLVVFFAAEFAASYRPQWLSIPLRIAASWLLAVGLMFFGLALKPLPDAATNPATAASDGSADVSPCPGPHRHAPDGEIVCLPVPTIDKAGTPSSIARYGEAPPEPSVLETKPKAGEASP